MFQIESLAGDFIRQKNRMLEGKFGEKINEDLDRLIKRKRELKRNEDSFDALKLLIELLVTNSWYYALPRDKQHKGVKIPSRLKKHLEGKNISKELQKAFGDDHYQLSDSAYLETRIGGLRSLVDGQDVFVFEDKHGELKAYRSPLYSGIQAFEDQFQHEFRKPASRRKLIELVGKMAPARKKQAKEKMHALLDQLVDKSIRRFTEELNCLAEAGESTVLGEKGRDNYLRDLGYWKRIPIDRHEMRFIIRTGIYHACSGGRACDPLEKKTMHNALTRFCSRYLAGEKVKGIDLGHAPGIVDLFVWYHCARDRYNICGNMPRCMDCLMKKSCFYGGARV